MCMCIHTHRYTHCVGFVTLEDPNTPLTYPYFYKHNKDNTRPCVERPRED